MTKIKNFDLILRPIILCCYCAPFSLIILYIYFLIANDLVIKKRSPFYTSFPHYSFDNEERHIKGIKANT